VKFFKQLGLWFLPEIAEASSSEEEGGRNAIQNQVVSSSSQQQCYDYQGLNQIIANQPSPSDRSDIKKNKIFETCCVVGRYWEKRNEKLGKKE
jgi:hypothetical protein